MTDRYRSVNRGIHWFGALCLTLLLCTTTFAQSTRYTLTGRVVDAEKQPVPGTTILIVGTTVGTTSDADGNYTLPVTLKPGPITLAFSVIGYETLRKNISLGNAPQLTVDAELTPAATNLDEVVVTGSTLSAPKRELGNAISTIKGTDLLQSGSGNLINSLQGKMPGAQITQNSGDPAGGITIRIRGIKSLSGSSDPLYVVDGVIVSNASTNVSQLALANDVGNANVGQNRLSDINPDDIATINVVNGAAAAAQYGSRAANGVVIITTKRGQSGKPQVTVSTSFNVNELRKSVPINTYGKQFGFSSLRLYPIGVISAAQVAANPGVTTTNIYRDGTLSALATNLVDVQRYNYFDQIFRTGYGTDNNISVSGGKDNTQYFVSFGYLKNEGIIKNTDFTRYNMRARVDQRLTNWAKVSVGISYINSLSNEKANGNVFYSPINSVNITNNIYDITQRDAAGNLQAVEPTRVNPLSTIEDMKFSQAVSRTINNIQLSLTPFKGLSIDYIAGVDAYSQFGKNYIRPYPYQAVAGLPAARYPNGFAATATNQVLQFNNDLNAQYERQFNDKFKINAAVGYSYQYYQADYAINSGQGLSPFIETVSGASSTYQVKYDLDRYSLSGMFAQATLGYRNLAFITGAVRRDQSSKFSPTQTNQYYPKVSGSFIVSDLDFWKGLPFNNAFNALKLRASYGEAGNLSGIGSYARFYQFSPVSYLSKNTVVPGTQLANPDVQPERMHELEGGVDLSFLNGRVNLGVTGYYQKITNLIVNRTLAPSTGGTSIVNNVGSMENKGVEVMLDVAPIKTKDFNWDFTVIYNRNRNKVLDLGGLPIISPDASSASGTPVYMIVGQPVGVFYGTAYARNPDGSLFLSPSGFPQSERAASQDNGAINYVPATRGSDGSIDATKPTANVLIGNPNPKWTGSFSTNLSYKKLTLHILLDAVQGVDVFNADKRTRQGVGIGDYAEQELRGTLKRGYIFGIYNTQEFRVDPGSYTKLREVALGYTLPKINGISRLNIAVVGRNLYSWDKYTGFDPETNAGGNNDLVRGIDFGNVPIPRTYQLKLTATF